MQAFFPSMALSLVQKNPRVRKIFVRNSGAENGCANFRGAWKNAFFLQEKAHVHYFGFWGGGGSADSIFMGARIFLISVTESQSHCMIPESGLESLQSPLREAKSESNRCTL